MDECRTSPPRGAVFAINMLVNTPDGGTYTWDECEQWLSTACKKHDREISSIDRITLEDQNHGLIRLRLGD